RAQNGNPSFGGTFIQYSQGGYVPQALASSNIHTYNGFIYPAVTPSNNYPFYTQPICTQPNISAYPNPGSVGLFADLTSCVTSFVNWIEDYPLLDRLKMPSHVDSYDGKGDPDNYLYHFEEAIPSKRSLQRHTSWYTTLSREKAKALDPSSPGIRKILLGTTTKDRKIETGSPRTVGLIMGCSATYPRARGKFWQHKRSWARHQPVPRIEVPNRSKTTEAVILKTLDITCKRDNRTPKRKSAEEYVDEVGEITFPPVSSTNSSNPVIIKPSIMSLRIDSKTPLVGFSREHSWPIGEVPLEITIVSTIHEAIKFHTPRGIGTIFFTRESEKAREEHKKLKGTSQKTPKGPIQVKSIIQEIQQGSCGMHVGPRFRIPQIIVFDNRKQFTEGIFLVFCQRLRILQAFTLVYHPPPQAKGQVEVTNRDIVKGMEQRVGNTHQGLVDKLAQ
ncbi:reverse transcriptase domain-containing protein, partial [Tanacetum coccineum]